MSAHNPRWIAAAWWMTVGLAAACSSSSQDGTGTVSDLPRTAKPQDSAQARPAVKSYPDRTPVDTARLTASGEVALQPQYLAIAPSGDRWAAATTGEVHLFTGTDLEGRAAGRFDAAGGIDFSADGASLYAGLATIDVASERAATTPEVPDLAAWASAQGLPAPPTLSIEGARRSADGQAIVVSATGRTRDRRHGRSRPETGSEDWLIELDGTSQLPVRALWHGRGPHQRIALSERYIAAGGRGGLRVFPRGGGEDIDLTGQLRAIIALGWSPDGELLAALGEENVVAIWRAGSFAQPVARWSFGKDYGSALRFHPTRPLLFTGGRDGHLRVWSVDAPRLTEPVEILARDLGGIINQVAVAPQGDWLLVAVGAPRGTIHRFDLDLAP